MHSRIKLVFLSVLLSTVFACNAKHPIQTKKLQLGAEQTAVYLPLLKDKTVALVVNQTSVIHSTHLVDSLLALGVNIKYIFAPEHGFRGDADAGEKIANSIDDRTGLPLISLYGSQRKPSAENLKGVDIVIFDIQDVGARFYTYISTLHYVMEACAENKVEVMVFDRPNPNGFYVDGPILESNFKSFVGMHPVPIVHGLTVGEYAKMMNGEGWLENKATCSLSVIPMKNYNRDAEYILPIKPSPNLPNQQSIYLYPSLCLFEGTVMSMGRGTYFPFQVLGHPDLKSQPFEFTPVSIVGMSKNPPHENKICFGIDLRGYEIENIKTAKQINLGWLIDFYRQFPEKEKFFIPFFERLAGTAELRKQIIAGKSEAEIRASWQPGLVEFKSIRNKYLLYP